MGALTLQTKANWATKPRSVRCAAVTHYVPPFNNTPAKPAIEAVSRRLVSHHLPKPFLVVTAPFELVEGMMEKADVPKDTIKNSDNNLQIRRDNIGKTVSDKDRAGGQRFKDDKGADSKDDKGADSFFDRVLGQQE